MRQTDEIYARRDGFIMELFSIGNFSINEFLLSIFKNNILQQIIWSTEFSLSTKRTAKVLHLSLVGACRLLSQ